MFRCDDTPPLHQLATYSLRDVLFEQLRFAD